jgi:F-type H+-transporting ATPase subunit a
MTVLGLLTGMVQAYIFSILATVYIAAATSVPKPKPALAKAQPEPKQVQSAQQRGKGLTKD